jgi:hypothetical protein
MKDKFGGTCGTYMESEKCVQEEIYCETWGLIGD